MSSSSGTGNSTYSHHEVMTMMVTVTVVLSVMSPGVPTASAVIDGICDAESFPIGDQRILCVSMLLANMVGLDFPVKKGGWYMSEDCAKNTTLYGYRTAGEGASGCMYEAQDYLEYQNCRYRIGGQAWGTGCYMRFEVYPFEI
ncbi:unnamed protein product [Linum trigynum]|uniref:Gnk2-homologous domain-containing protein n=1 Tax=Linum trigynum TaxID=586398 RepID=A0AAV2CQ30_9ROSI